MKKQVTIENVGNVTLTDKNYIASGGEAAVYQSGKYAVKLYHDVKKSISKNKMLELSKIQANNVLKPKHVVYESNNVVGYAMDYIKKTEALCKLFTKSFKQTNNITPQMIIHLIKEIQETVALVHYDDCLIVDLNELNVLVSKNFKLPYFIDTDSYQTPGFKATAIMDSIRDRTTTYGQFSELTDWYAFAILAFQLYIGIHPYKGKHPKYKPSEWSKRMDDGISVFDKSVKLPPVCNNFNVIPPRHKVWMEDLFIHGNRSEPPQIDSSVPIAIVPKVVVVNSTDTIGVTLETELKSIYHNIIDIYDIMGVKYFITKDAIFKSAYNTPTNIGDGFKDYDKILVTTNGEQQPVLCKLKHKTLTFNDFNIDIAQVQTEGMIEKNGFIYTMFNGNLYRNSFFFSGARKLIHRIDPISQVSEYSSTMYDGVIYQDLLSKSHLTVPLDNKCLNYHIKEIDGYRVLDMKLKRHICVVMAEKGGKYYRFVINFDYDMWSYDVRITDDVSYDTINFTTLKNGVCILLIENGQIEIFRDNTKIKIVDNAPFDSSMKLYSFGNDVFFTEKDELYKITMK